MSVDLPAPLSPTRAVTLPGCTLRSTPFRTLTGPKDFLTPTSWMIGSAPTDVAGVGVIVSDMLASLGCRGPARRGVTPCGATPLAVSPQADPLLGRDSVLLASSHHVGRADVVVIGVAGSDHVLDLVGSDQDRRDLDVRRAVLELCLRGHLVALEQGDGGVDSSRGLVLDRLVDRGGLP